MNIRQDFHTTPDYHNPEVLSINRAPAHSPWRAYPSEGAAALYPAESPYRVSLNGTYAFKLYDRPELVEDFFRADYDASGFADIAVPGCWETQGYGEPIYTNYVYPWSYALDEKCVIRPGKDMDPQPNPPYIPKDNPTGCYRRVFALPEGFSGRDSFLCFEGVEAVFYLWVNGKPVGYSQDSKLPCTFNITKYVQPGENLIALQVMSRADSIYLEDQDYWHISGIHRPVWLVSKPKMRINDYKLTAVPDLHTGVGVFTADISVARKDGFAEYIVRAALYDGDVKLNEGTGAIRPSAEYRNDYAPTANAGCVTFSLPKVALWSPESPKLYTAVVSLVSPDGEVVDVEACRIGFKLLTQENGVIHLNGKRLIIRGVNRHEHCWEHGRAVPREHMVEEIKQMKAMNINSVRTCHYPDSVEWYELCDEMGILLVCECNIETHGVMGGLTHNPYYAQAFVERAMRMAVTHKNHVSIYSWSLGNESGCGPNHAAMYGFIKEYDKTRFCQYEAGEPGANMSDIRGNMYATVDKILQMLADPADRRPVILVEYLYQIRASGGGMKQFLTLLERHPLFQGGYIWDWQDKALMQKTADGKPFFAHGGDFGESVTDWVCPKFMTNNGIVLADLTWKPVAHEVKQAYAPVWLEPPNARFNAWATTAEETRYILKNRCLSESTAAFRCVAALRENGVVICEQEIALPDLPPMTEDTIDIHVPHEKKPGAAYHLTLAILRRNGGEEIGFRQYALASGAPVVPTPTAQAPVMLREDGAAITAECGGLAVTWDKNTSAIVQFSKNGAEYISGGAPCFDRPYTGLDAEPDWGWRPVFGQLRGMKTVTSAAAILKSDNAVRVEFPFVMEGEHTPWGIAGRLAYTLSAEGLRVEYAVSADESFAALPRVGLEFTVPAGFEQLAYYGYGTMENYRDRLFAAALGVHTSTVGDEHFPYAPPSECGGHEQTRWLTLTDGTGHVLRIAGAQPFHFDAKHHTVADYQQAMHDHELPARAETILHIDAAHAAIGSDMAWSTAMPPEERIPGGAYALCFTITAE